MIIYLITTIIIIIYALIGNVNKNKKSKKIFLIISFGMLTIIAMLRKKTIGIDLDLLYAPVFEQLKQLDFSQITNIGLEIGYLIINKIILLFSTDVQTLIIITSLCTFPIYGWFIYKNSKDVAMSTIFFVIACTYYMELNVVRQALAISFILIAYECIKNKKIMGSIIFILIATSIHASAIICLLMIPLTKIKFKKSYFINTFMIIIILMIFINPIITIYSNVSSSLGLSNNKSYDTYLESEKYGVGYINLVSISNILFLFIVFVLGYYGLLVNEKDKNIKENKYDFLLFMVTIAFITNILSLKMSILSRLTLYFMPFVFIMIPEALLAMKNRKNRQLVACALFIFVFIRYIYISRYLAETLYGVVPYQFFWQ